LCPDLLAQDEIAHADSGCNECAVFRLFQRRSRNTSAQQRIDVSDDPHCSYGNSSSHSGGWLTHPHLRPPTLDKTAPDAHTLRDVPSHWKALRSANSLWQEYSGVFHSQAMNVPLSAAPTLRSTAARSQMEQSTAIPSGTAAPAPDAARPVRSPACRQRTARNRLSIAAGTAAPRMGGVFRHGLTRVFTDNRKGRQGGFGTTNGHECRGGFEPRMDTNGHE
jgi:hypothetical protein